MLGLIGKKVGMTQVFDANGRLTPVTVIKIEDNVVIANRTEEKNGYSAAVLGTGAMKKSTITKPYAGQFKDIEVKKTVMEFRDFDNEVAVGDVLGVDLFKDVTFVDVTGTSKGKGYQGGMKRYGFGGGRATGRYEALWLRWRKGHARLEVPQGPRRHGHVINAIPHVQGPSHGWSYG